ncbi:hypothetical protein [Sodalis sp. (in: enterobacteria)]|uniref:hypothetical protein n=1 Tax=Sodalis sp. (in: enterobacteria) TaxID=1898979 RepID=UPI003F2F1CD6
MLRQLPLLHAIIGAYFVIHQQFSTFCVKAFVERIFYEAEEDTIDIGVNDFTDLYRASGAGAFAGKGRQFAAF